MLRITNRITLLLLSLFVFAACDSTDADPEPIDNIATVTLNGAAVSASNTFAFFHEGPTEDTDGNEITAFALVMSENDVAADISDWNDVIMLGRYGTRPETGTYDLAHYDVTAEEDLPKDGSFVFFRVQSDENTFFIADGGTLTVTESTSDVVSGSFSASGFSLTISESGGVQASPGTYAGTFTAVADPILFDDELL